MTLLHSILTCYTLSYESSTATHNPKTIYAVKEKKNCSVQDLQFNLLIQFNLRVLKEEKKNKYAMKNKNKNI